jgi:translation initiation factor 1
MGKKRKQPTTRTSPPEAPGGGLGSLAGALAARGLVASPPSTAEAGAAPSAAAPLDPTILRGKAVVRQERKGRGGKTVTLVDGAAIGRVADLDGLAKALRKALGTGARVEGGKVVLQGDQRGAAAAWLEGRGAKVVVGN